MAQLTAETLKKALWLFCDVAYFRKTVPSKVLDKADFPITADIAELLTSKTIVEQSKTDDATGIQKYWIRMGNDFYPHMKICISQIPENSESGTNKFVFAVDTHDQHMLNILPQGSSQWQEIYDIHQKNMKLKKKVEKRWRREGVPTERTMLEGETLDNQPRKADFPHRRVLIADDENHIRLALIEILNLFNCEALIATKGQEALDLAHEYGDDIAFALFDIMMPDVTGLNVVDTLKKEGNLIFPYVFLSGMPRKEADPNNEHEFIGKPFTKQMLIDKIQEMIQQLAG